MGFVPDDEKIRTGWPNADAGPETSRFNETLYTTGVIYPFDRSKWHREAERLFGDPDALGSADELTLRKGLTYHARADRFNEGHLDEMIAAGHITMILRRIKELQEC
jgi:O-acetyl-ADP-ribose deacetylase